jgi:alpha-galactosidase
MTVLVWSPHGLAVQLLLGDDAPVRLRGVDPAGDPRPGASVPLVELGTVAEGRASGAGAQHRGYAASQALRYVSHEEAPDRLLVVQRDERTGLEVRTTLRQYGTVPVLRVANEVVNTGKEPIVLTYVSSLSLTGFGRLADLRLHEARNAWCAEVRWQCQSAEQAGLVDIGTYGDPATSTSKARHAVTAVGSWSTGDFLPLGIIENTTDGRCWAWQVEHPGGWHWEVSDLGPDLYLAASGPTGPEHGWREELPPGGRYTTVPVAVGVSDGGPHEALRLLTGYRRAIRRPSGDHERLPVIFNDYMNCLMGDPTEDRETPLIAAAAGVGAEYFVIDAGWYADHGDWWNTVGEWEPSPARFPSGIEATLDRIRRAGMVPGLWLEPEVVGVRSPLVDKLPPAAFLTDSGHRIQENGRFHLDYRCPEVRDRMDAVVDRLVGGYGVGYLKLDYNVDVRAPGLLGHNRAYLAWLDAVLDRHPDLVLENCASGGMRMDYALLSRMALQSTSDQTDPLRYAPIAASAPSAVTPEQGAVWAYPQPEHTAEEASLCLVNAMLGRVHLSGRIDRMSPEQLARVATAIDVYQRNRGLLARGYPHWPLGLPGWHDEWLALAVGDGDEWLLAVWYRGTGAGDVTIPLPWPAEPTVLFPSDLPVELGPSGRDLRLALAGGPAARVIHLRRSA